MFPSQSQAEYVPLTTHADGDFESPNNDNSHKTYLHSKYLPAVLIAILSIANILLLPFSLSPSRSQLSHLPYPDPHLGLDRAAKAMPLMPAYVYAWPDKITRLSQKLKSAVYGEGPQVFISVQDSTLMRFPIPANGTRSCAITWTPPPPLGPRQKDLGTKGDISEIEVWSTIAPSAIHSLPSSNSTPGLHLDFDNLSWSTRPVAGELLGTLDLTARPNATTIEFACPQERSLTVELRCLRVACEVQFIQVDFVPKMGFELVRRMN
jgi:hypothetical protein